MRTKPTWLWMMLLVLMAGCARDTSWKEEVKLSDGRTIVVERETIRVMGGPELAHGGSGSSPTEHRIRFEFPAGSKAIVEWRSTKKSGMGWPETPLVLDYEAEAPYVITLNSGNGCLFYSMYVYQHGTWSEKQLGDEIPQRNSNLFLKSGPQMPEFVDLANKEEVNSSKGYDKSMRIVGPAKAICANAPTNR